MSLASVAMIVVVDDPNQIRRKSGKRRVAVQSNVLVRDVKLPAFGYLVWAASLSIHRPCGD